MANFTRLGNRVEIPELFSGASIVRARIARNPGCHFVLRVKIGFAGPVHVCSDDDYVLVDCGNFGERDVHRDFAVFAEFGIGLSGLRVQRYQLVRAGEENSRRIVGVAGPIRDAARRD